MDINQLSDATLKTLHSTGSIIADDRLSVKFGKARKREAPEDQYNTGKRQKTSGGYTTELLRLKLLVKQVHVIETKSHCLSLEPKRHEDTISPSRKPEAPKKKMDNATKSTSKGTGVKDFEAKYEQLQQLGKGGNGCVFTGYRRADHLPVAIKHIPQRNVIRCGTSQSGRGLPLEVATMLKMVKSRSGLVGKSAAISLLDYFDVDQELILILERPDPVLDLLDYMNFIKRYLMEEEARVMMKQLVQAALELQAEGIFHRDIKLENILIETGTKVPRLRLIDFGHSCFTNKDSVYRTLRGTRGLAPPEWLQCSTYTAGPCTVWQLGIILFEMLHETFETSLFLENKIPISKNLSQNCQQVLRLCLTEDPQQRPSLEKLQHHPWLS